MYASILFEDKDVKITSKEVIIKCYYFPFAISKKIPISNIKFISFRNFAFRGNFWGFDIEEKDCWMPPDLNRLDYDHFIAIDVGEKIIPSFTCTDMEKAYKILMELFQTLHQQQ